jgi:hypothetical protein
MEILNKFMEFNFKWWCSFILCQYKTCWRNDTKFWIEHKQIQFEYYENIVKNLDMPHTSIKETMMFSQSFAAKDIQWKTTLTEDPFEISEVECETINHLDWINNIRES